MAEDQALRGVEILTKLLFASPLFSPDFIILFENPLCVRGYGGNYQVIYSHT